MILKFNTIENLASFKSFSWDEAMGVANGTISREACFSDINIIYGANGSGKTSLSRILRSWETKRAFGFTETPKYAIVEGGFSGRPDVITEENFIEKNKLCAVFNSDFVEDNLSFNPRHDGGGRITSFAVVGNKNKELKDSIDALNQELGELGKPGLFTQLAEARSKWMTAESRVKENENTIHKILFTLANSIIKTNENLNRFQGYNVPRLKEDIAVMQRINFQQLNEVRVSEIKETLAFPQRSQLKSYKMRRFDIGTLSRNVRTLLRAKIESSVKLEDLVYDGVLSAWVQEGMHLHEDRKDRCAFCGSEISPLRWEKLRAHFNNEVQQFGKQIDDLYDILVEEKNILQKAQTLEDYINFSYFNEDIIPLHAEGESLRRLFIARLDKLIGFLNWRKQNILSPNPVEFDYSDAEVRMKDWESRVSECIAKVNNFLLDLNNQKNGLRDQLRFDCISKYLAENRYDELLKANVALTAVASEREVNVATLERSIQEKEKLIKEQKAQYVSEEAGAARVNKYLEKFGNKTLSLHTVREDERDGTASGVYFEVRRGEKRAYNLSEGESRMIAFCYFMAKLPAKVEEDNPEEKAPEYPIIWIDDPICSLDASHIFDVYSLISAEIADKKRFAQLFISTHNLEFLRYLRRLKADSCKMAKFVVEKHKGASVLKRMPKYLENFVSEFNSLFEIIYQSAQATCITDDNISMFRVLPNSMRKFFEIYFTFMYPDGKPDKDSLIIHLKQFCGGENFDKAYRISRICNEGSHMFGRLEGATTPPAFGDELIRAAREAVKLIQDKMPEQYTCLLTAINVNEEASAQGDRQAS